MAEVWGKRYKKEIDNKKLTHPKAPTHDGGTHAPPQPRTSPIVPTASPPATPAANLPSRSAAGPSVLASRDLAGFLP